MSVYKTGVWTEGAVKERALPEGYTELDYLESTGTQYIDMGIVGKNNIRAETDVIFTSIPNDGCLLGSRTGNNRIYLFYIYPGKFNLGYGNNYTSTIAPVANQKYNLKVKLNTGEQNLLIDDTSILTQNVSTTMDSTVNLYLFCNNYGSASYYVNAKVYTLKIWFNDILVRNFIPALRNIDNVPGMYDTVTKIFFTNSGTGEFKYMLKGVPSDYAVVDYIQSTGTQWIDSGASGVVDADMDIISTDTNSQTALLWAENSSSPWGCSGLRAASGAWNLGTGAAHTQGPAIARPNRRYRVQFNTDMSNYYLKVNNVTLMSGTSSSAISENNLYIFACNGGGTAKQFGKYKLFSCKIYQNNELIKNFVPCYRKSDNEPGLYDTVNNEFKTNSGTGTLTVSDFRIETANVKIFKNGNTVEADSFFEI